MKLTSAFIILLSYSTIGFCQMDSTNMIAYSEGYMLKDGIYLNIDEFKNNSPSYPIKSYGDILEQFEKTSDEFFVKNKWLVTNHTGLTYEIPSNSIWGVSILGIPYIKNAKTRSYNELKNKDDKMVFKTPIKRQSDFQLIKYFGELCFIPIMKGRKYNSSIYTKMNDSPPLPKVGTVITHDLIVLDMERNKFHILNNEFIEQYLSQKHPETLQEFKSHVKKVKKKNISLFWLRKINEKYPFYIPETTEWE